MFQISIKYALEEPYRPKLLRHTPSLKAIKTYNDLPVEGNFDTTIDTSVFFLKLSPNSLRKYDSSSISRDSLGSDSKSNENNSCDYATVGTVSNSGSELNSDQNDLGSTARLISPKVQQVWNILVATYHDFNCNKICVINEWYITEKYFFFHAI